MDEIFNVKRTALVLRLKQPFFDWLKSIESDNDPNSDMREGDVYLLPDYEEISEIENWLKKNFDTIFTEQLNNWYVDDSLWVKNRTFKMFQDWFDYSLHTMVWDIGDKPIEKL